MNRYDCFATNERYHSIRNPISEERFDFAARCRGIRGGIHALDD
jgi:hypothetical protein